MAGVDFVVADLSQSLSHPAIVKEFLQDVYGLGCIRFEPGDVVIDIGAHVGLESIYLAKRYPFLTIYSYEPVAANFASLQENIRANGVTNIRAFQRAVTKDGRPVVIWTDLVENSGGGGHDRPADHFQGRTAFPAQSITLDGIIEEHGIKTCKLLKIDCEGAEHEILRGTRNLSRIEYLSGEFHVDAHLQSQGHTIDGLLNYLAEFIPRNRIRIVRDDHL